MAAGRPHRRLRQEHRLACSNQDGHKNKSKKEDKFYAMPSVRLPSKAQSHGGGGMCGGTGCSSGSELLLLGICFVFLSDL